MSQMNQFLLAILSLFKQEVQARLEAARGEVNMTNSRIGSIERELQTTRFSLKSYQTALSSAKYDLVAARHGGEDLW